MKCGHCHGEHPSAPDVKACYQAAGKLKGAAEALARATGAVAATVRVETRQPDGTLLVEAQDDFARLAAIAVEPVQVGLGSGGVDSAPKPGGPTANVRRNKFGGRCAKCDVWVEVDEGLLLGEKGAYRVEHEGDCPEKRHLPTAAVFEAIPEGRYAVQGEDGTYDFYEVDKPVKGKYAGRTFVALLTGSIGCWRTTNLRHANATTILAKIEKAGAEESARMFGYKARACGYCLSPLSNPQSRVAGYGETCAGNHGFWYPTLAEALAILKERGEDVDGDGPAPDADRCQRHGTPLSVGWTVTADGRRFGCVECAEEHDELLAERAETEAVAEFKLARDLRCWYCGSETTPKAECEARHAAAIEKAKAAGHVCRFCLKPWPNAETGQVNGTCSC